MKLDTLMEAGIYDMDQDATSDPEVLVQGVGRYKLSRVKDNVRRKLADLGKMAEASDDPEVWEKIKWMLNHAAMHEMVNTITTAHKELKKEIH